MKRLPLNQKNYTVHRERDVRALMRLALLLLCGLLLAGGFVYAGGQHFAAVQYGYKSEELRREHEALMVEHRRLRLEVERANTPEHLGSAARELGLQPIQPAQMDPARNVEQTQIIASPAFVRPSASLGQ